MKIDKQQDILCDTTIEKMSIISMILSHDVRGFRKKSGGVVFVELGNASQNKDRLFEGNRPNNRSNSDWFLWNIYRVFGLYESKNCLVGIACVCMDFLHCLPLSIVCLFHMIKSHQANADGSLRSQHLINSWRASAGRPDTSLSNLINENMDTSKDTVVQENDKKSTKARDAAKSWLLVGLIFILCFSTINFFHYLDMSKDTKCTELINS